MSTAMMHFARAQTRAIMHMQSVWGLSPQSRLCQESRQHWPGMRSSPLPHLRNSRSVLAYAATISSSLAWWGESSFATRSSSCASAASVLSASCASAASQLAASWMIGGCQATALACTGGPNLARLRAAGHCKLAARGVGAEARLPVDGWGMAEQVGGKLGCCCDGRRELVPVARHVPHRQGVRLVP